MFLKSLTLKGFKSFADSTTLEFEPGVTVVVGPNGSGKSNIVDAVAWVLGAQGPRTVRSSKMEDVIFAGSSKRPALGRAEVSLTIDNSAGLLPIEFSEVTITRTLFRTGESEYAINRVPCRLLDIQELLSDTGVGRQQHTIVSQGNLDAVLNSRPEERRLIIEEAAGILKYRRRKEKSERRLESTEASLVRLQDLLREVRRQLRPLEKQAEAARRHGDLVAELDAVRRHLLGRDLTNVEARLAGAARDKADLARTEEQVRLALGRLDAQILASEAEAHSSGANLQSDLGELLSRAEALKARASGMVALLNERQRSIQRSMSATVDVDVVASLEAEAAALVERLQATDQDALNLMPVADELTEAERALAEETEAVETQWGGDESPIGDPAAEVRGELGGLRAALDRSAGELRRLEARLEVIAQRSTRLEGEATRLREAAAEAIQRAPELARAEQDARAAEASAEAELAAVADRRRAADADHQRWMAREEALSQALAHARARAGAERLAGVGGVVGTLMELVEIDPGLEAAFEAAAGEVLAAVVVENLDAARKGLEELHRHGGAGAVVALPDLDAPRAAAAHVSGAEPLRRRARALLPGVEALLDQLLGSTVVAEGSWSQALDVAIAYPNLIVVTTDGDRFSGGLWRAGAGGAGATAAAVEEARRQVEAAASRVAEAEAAHARASREAEAARHAATAASKAQESGQGRRRSSEEGLRRAEHELAEAQSELEAGRAQRAELEERLTRERARVSELEAILPALEQAAEAEAERAAAERAARSRLAERSAAVAAMRRDLEVRAAGLEERRSLTERRLREVEERLRRNVTEREEAQTRRVNLERASEVTGRLLAFVLDREQATATTVARLRDARRVQAEADRERVEKLDQLRRQRSAAERQLSEIRERISRVQLSDTEARVRLETLTETIRRDLDCEPEAIRGAECPELPPGTSATSRRAELERELRLMGPINPLALEEHTALMERHDFLEAQLEDVRRARRELTKVIRAIDAEIVEVFRAAYADVADNFERLFSTLFPGGQGRLRLTDPEQLLETGIEVEARPSGKNVRRLSLLSGGERSLTALAFLFAVFRSRPSPFYMMDEVEAALDDVNLHRFLDLVHEFRDEAQLLIVSHQKRTMEAADCLYGVTMVPGGSSRVVSERVSAAATN
ncbi:MAG TPA: chromosome segregation protein SMC [Acidimicrobiales bacterium]